MTEGPQQRRYACDDPVVMGVYGPGEKVMSGRTVIRDLQTNHPIQPHTPFFIQRTMGPSGHVGGGGRGDSTSCEVRVVLDQHGNGFSSQIPCLLCQINQHPPPPLRTIKRATCMSNLGFECKSSAVQNSMWMTALLSVQIVADLTEH